MTAPCFSVPNNNVPDIVEQSLAEFKNFAETAFTTSMDAITDIVDSGIQEIGVGSGSVTINPDSQFANYVPFDKPEVPEAPNLTFTFNTEQPGIGNFANIDLTIDGGSVPVAPDAPLLSFPIPPGALTATPPGDAPAVGDYDDPTAPTITLPDVPTLLSLNLPTIDEPDVDAITAGFDALRSQKPDTPDDPYAEFTDYYNPTKARSDAFLAENTLTDGVVVAITSMLDGLGIPAQAETALRDRAISQVERDGAATVKDAMNEFTSRGWTLPTGPMLARVDAARDRAFEAKRTISRDIYIENQRIIVENWRFAVTSGLNLEQQYRSHFIALHNSALDFSNAVFNAAIGVHQARIQLFGAQIQAWQVESQIYRDWLQVELSKLEIFRQKIEAERLRNEINVQNIELYRVRLQGVLATIEIYKAQIDAVNAKIAGDTARIEGYRAEVSAYQSLVQAKEAEFRGYAARIGGEEAKASIYESQTRAYASAVSARTDTIRSQTIEGELRLKYNDQLVNTYTAAIDGWKARLQAEIERIRAGSLVYQGRAQIFSAEVGAEQARAVSDTRGFELDLTRYQITKDLALKQADQEIQEADRAQQRSLQASIAAAQVGASLSAAAMSAVNLGATMSNGFSSGISASCGISYSGEV